MILHSLKTSKTRQLIFRQCKTITHNIYRYLLHRVSYRVSYCTLSNYSTAQTVIKLCFPLSSLFDAKEKRSSRIQQVAFFGGPPHPYGSVVEEAHHFAMPSDLSILTFDPIIIQRYKYRCAAGLHNAVHCCHLKERT